MHVGFFFFENPRLIATAHELGPQFEQIALQDAKDWNANVLSVHQRQPHTRFVDDLTRKLLDVLREELDRRAAVTDFA
jgi:hypothetical protein